MKKKLLFSFLILALAFSAFAWAPAASADGQVCGMDNVTYSSAQAAAAAGVDVSYEFACAAVTDESKLYEAKTDIHFVGQLIEIGSTDLPTTIIVSDNKTDQHYTVNVTDKTVLGQRKDQYTKLSDWIPGDQIRVIGVKNENTDTVDATILVDLSIQVNVNRAVNGWITKISSSTNEITYQWANKEYTFQYDGNTKFVAGLKNPAGVADLKINDRIRGRMLFRINELPLAKIVVVLRRGESLFMKIRTFRPNATLVRLDSTIVPTTMQVRIDKTPGLLGNDVNNLIGAEGALTTVNITEDTVLVRKYFGKTTLDEFSIGDKLLIVGRVNDDGTVDAKVLKNNTIWKVSTQGVAGVVTEVNTEKSFITINWTAYKHITRDELKDKLKESDEAVSAQLLAKVNLRDALKEKIKNILPEKVGNFLRSVQFKKVTIDRIKHPDVKIGDLIKRLPVKKAKVSITKDTKIIVGTNNNATIADIKVGDKVRIRGTFNTNTSIVTAETIVVVNSLPEIEEPLTVSLDDVNEVVGAITTDDSDNSLAADTETDTEEVIEDSDGDNASDGPADDSNDSIEKNTATSTEENSISN